MERARQRWLVASFAVLLAGIVVLAADMHAVVEVDPDRSARSSQSTVRTGLGWGWMGGVFVAAAVALWIRGNGGPPFRRGAPAYAAVAISTFFIARSLLAQRGWSSAFAASEGVDFTYHGWVLVRTTDPLAATVQPVFLLAVLLGAAFLGTYRLLPRGEPA